MKGILLIKKYAYYKNIHIKSLQIKCVLEIFNFQYVTVTVTFLKKMWGMNFSIRYISQYVKHYLIVVY